MPRAAALLAAFGLTFRHELNLPVPALRVCATPAPAARPAERA